MRRTCSVHVPLLAVNRYAKGALTHSRCSSAARWVPEAGVVPASAARSIPSLVSPEMPQQQNRAGQFPALLLQQSLATDGVDSPAASRSRSRPGAETRVSPIRLLVFPACAGMNRRSDRNDRCDAGVARLRGNELARLIHRMTAIRWRVSRKLLTAFTDWVSRPNLSAIGARHTRHARRYD